MIYLKSLFAGLVAVVLLFVATLIYLWATTSEERGAGTIAFDPISAIRLGPLLIILAAFAAGFLREFRRASR